MKDETPTPAMDLFQELIKFFESGVNVSVDGEGIEIFDEANGLLIGIYAKAKEKDGVQVSVQDFIEHKRLETPLGLGEDQYFSDRLHAYTVRGKDYSVIFHFLHHKMMEFDDSRELLRDIKDYLRNVLRHAYVKRTGILTFGKSKPFKDIQDEDPLILWLSEHLRERHVRAFFDEYGLRFLGYHHYNGKRWGNVGYDATLLLQFVDEKFKDLARSIARRYDGRENELNNKLKRELKLLYRPVVGAISFENGVLLWSEFERTGSLTLSLKPHDPSFLVVNHIAYNIALDRLKGLESFLPPKSQDDLLTLFERLAPRSFKAFRAWVETDDEKETRKYMTLLLEIIGYTLYPHRVPFKKAFILIGPGDNGKSTYLNLITKILGEENYTSLNFDQLTEGKFELAELFGKLANISNEPPETLKKANRIKTLISESDPIMTQKKFKDPRQFRNYAKFIFGANNLPKTESTDRAFWGRWIIIDFPNTFPRNPKFFDETFTTEEIEGIIICALYAFYLVLEQGKFSDNPDFTEVMDRWNRESDTIIKAYEELLNLGIIEIEQPPLQHFILKDHLTELIRDRLRRLGESKDDPRKIYRVLKQRYDYITQRESRPTINGRQQWIINGIKILQCDEVERIVGPINYPPCNEWRGDYNVYKYSL